MKKVAVFGNTGGGKSTLSKILIEQAQSTKSIYHIQSTEQISQFLELIENETDFED